MTREEVIEWLEETRLGGKMIGDKQLVEVCDMAIAALDEQEERRWIPVTEQLPETDTCVLVRVNGNPHKYITLKGAYELAEYDPEGWILEMWPEWMDAEVTHWMPLPKPPKEVER